MKRLSLVLAISLVLLGRSLYLYRHQSLIYAAPNCEQISCNKDTQDEDAYLRCIKEKQSCWEQKISEAQSSSITLTNTISILNGQISVQQLEIERTLAEIQQLEKDIDNLSQRIEGLNISLDRLTTMLVKRVNEQYKQQHSSPKLLLLLTNNLGESFKQYHYLSAAQAHTTKAMQLAESQKQTYDEQKELKQEKQAQVAAKKQQLDAQQAQLTQQRKDQQFLLNETKSNEARYQAELAKTLSELQAIQSIIAGKGDETKVKDISQGENIASIIVGASACSTGTHLHFEVVKDGTHRNPAEYLSSIDPIWNNSPDGTFGFSGGWDWPVHNPAKINQGYGMTWYARVKRAYGGAPHTGIDVVSKSSGNYAVRAVKNGTLYRGSIACGGGLLRYVKVEHKDEDVDTYYMHINY